jgi:hypothetical protein
MLHGMNAQHARYIEGSPAVSSRHGIVWIEQGFYIARETICSMPAKNPSYHAGFLPQRHVQAFMLINHPLSLMGSVWMISNEHYGKN